ncbi:uncharacterized protein BO80DRAFT_403971 [Aspergillus ibericus CBS 121593]|uniref:Protein kinase domain-containing protein n=1 Tax=Aspergillus ibericus CBS 121593 TaxID=1448316 RepID=A0A395H3L1_9EURO|nr:hypothetical protein BO80DRAFT_403971 [Aspergillus ibericus CBS 121593]RAL02462.1 hypothetical protein BO80DRAFT_403971 [Aspergillus ibericus CBS 121593]
MESASDLIARPLPPINKLNGTNHPSVSRESISARFLHEWEGFETDVRQACNELDLSQMILATDESEEWRTGTELGLTGRFAKHVGDAVMKALSVTDLSDVKFGDYQTITPHDPDNIPDVILLELPDTALLVGEIETFWTLSLERHPVRRGFSTLVPLQSHFGQLVSYMRCQDLKYGFLSTYKSTVFMRRVAPYRFEISMPILASSTNPSVRQCFVAIAKMASQDPDFFESPDFAPELLKVSSRDSFQASTRPSPLRNQVVPKEATGEKIGCSSIFFGRDASEAQSWINCKRLLHGSKQKAIYEVTWNGEPAVAKCWSPSYEQFYVHESITYENIHAKRELGYEFFPKLLNHGAIACSSIFPKGYVLVMTKVPGKILADLWDTLSGSDKEHVRKEIRKAVVVLRSISAIVVDSGKHNVLFDPATRAVTMLDFELMQACEPDTQSPDWPEMPTIFGDLARPARVRHGG